MSGPAAGVAREKSGGARRTKALSSVDASAKKRPRKGVVEKSKSGAARRGATRGIAASRDGDGDDDVRSSQSRRRDGPRAGGGDASSSDASSAPESDASPVGPLSHAGASGTSSDDDALRGGDRGGDRGDRARARPAVISRTHSSPYSAAETFDPSAHDPAVLVAACGRPLRPEDERPVPLPSRGGTSSAGATLREWRCVECARVNNASRRDCARCGGLGEKRSGDEKNAPRKIKRAADPFPPLGAAAAVGSDADDEPALLRVLLPNLTGADVGADVGAERRGGDRDRDDASWASRVAAEYETDEFPPPPPPPPPPPWADAFDAEFPPPPPPPGPPPPSQPRRVVDENDYKIVTDTSPPSRRRPDASSPPNRADALEALTAALAAAANADPISDGHVSIKSHVDDAAATALRLAREAASDAFEEHLALTREDLEDVVEAVDGAMDAMERKLARVAAAAGDGIRSLARITEDRDARQRERSRRAADDAARREREMEAVIEAALRSVDELSRRNRELSRRVDALEGGFGGRTSSRRGPLPPPSHDDDDDDDDNDNARRLLAEMRAHAASLATQRAREDPFDSPLVIAAEYEAPGRRRVESRRIAVVANVARAPSRRKLEASPRKLDASRPPPLTLTTRATPRRADGGPSSPPPPPRGDDRRAKSPAWEAVAAAAEATAAAAAAAEATAAEATAKKPPSPKTKPPPPPPPPRPKHAPGSVEEALELIRARDEMLEERRKRKEAKKATEEEESDAAVAAVQLAAAAVPDAPPPERARAPLPRIRADRKWAASVALAGAIDDALVGE